MQYVSRSAGPADDPDLLGVDPVGARDATRPRSGRGAGSGRRARAAARSGTGGRKPRRSRSPLWARLMVSLGALLMMASGGTIVAFKVVIAAATGSITQQNLLGSAGAGNDAKHASITGAKNILLVGVDSRPGQNPNDLVRSDSIIILHIPADHSEGFLVSIPRDTYADIPDYDNGAYHHRESHEKINGAFAWGGYKLTGAASRQHAVELLALTVKQMTGITFDAAAIVDFSGFQNVVDALGGVYMCVDEDTRSIHIGYTKSGKQVSPAWRLVNSVPVGPIPGVTPKEYKPGCYTMRPWEALDFVRQRDLLANGDGDYGRQRHQQQFIKAVAKQIMTKGVLTNPGKLKKVLDAVGKSMTLDTGQFSIQDWIFGMQNVGSNLITLKTNGGKFHSETINKQSYETLDDTSMQMLQSVRDDTMDAFIQTHSDLVAQS